MKKFFAVIGNPPYQDQAVGEQKTFQKPIYNDFLDESFKVSNKVELVHPARFLFNAGSTPKAWNRKMLADPHFKILSYETDSRVYFPNQEIKGGIVVSYHDANSEIGPVGIFTPYPELNTIVKKVKDSSGFISFESIVITRTAYRLTDEMHSCYPEAINQLSDGHPYDMSTNIFDRIPQVFNAVKPDDGNQYISILGRENGSRSIKWIRRDFVTEVDNLDAYKLFMSSANGSGKYGEVLTAPVKGDPGEGATETFISIGKFNNAKERDNAGKYISCKFARAMLGILKSTHHLTPSTWGYTPLQDFTDASDIDWSQPVADVDRQLYAKYGLSPEEIEFIETHVKEMS